MRIKVDDIVEVLSGDDKGKRAKVLRVDHDAEKVVVEGVSQVLKHVKRSQKNPQGGRLKKEMPISWSNVMVVCPKCSKASRTGARFGEDGSKERFCKKCGSGLGVIAPAHSSHAKK